MTSYPKRIEKINNWINGKTKITPNPKWVEKYDPHSGKLMSVFIRSQEVQINQAVLSAQKEFKHWSNLTSISRGQILMNVVQEMKLQKRLLSQCVSKETGKKFADAMGEVNAAIMQGEYFASEGMRFHGKSINSMVPEKTSFTIRQPHGVAALIVPANTPIANIAWKVFPALICGNTAILKSSEDAPAIANLFAKLAHKAGLPSGVLNVIHGYGSEAGDYLVNNQAVKVISFTGSTNSGRTIAKNAARRLARLSLELGGKNPFIVCNDADLDNAANWATLSAFSNAGQRCAAGSRIIVYKSIYKKFKEKFVSKTKTLKLGVDQSSDLGPVINSRQLQNILDIINNAKAMNGKVLCGGKRCSAKGLKNGYYIRPTIIEGLSNSHEINQIEIFGPVATLIMADDLHHALEIANDTNFGLTAAIHTSNIDTALWFSKRVRSGVANVNCGTYGSEPHMPFGGFGLSGNGTREPGVEALDVYSELKNISFVTKDLNI